MQVLLIDNYDSFVYNLYQCLGELGAEVIVKRNNEITIGEVKQMKPDKIVLSPGPGNPENEKDFGICKQILNEMNAPILGVCLGHQGIISHFEGKIIRAERPMHGKTSLIRHNENGIFAGMENPLNVMRYHSLLGTKIPDCLEITAETEEKEVMAIKHKQLPIYGVQFHPESIKTEKGKKILENFLKMSD
ncbi:MAG: aminodeoxychorismate/anthranilate synthase component II [Candidatus Micrarchaeota archaeon]